MNYESLKKIYYTEPDIHEKIYRQRFSSPFSKHINMEIRQFNHDKTYTAFWCYTEELTSLIEKIYKQHEQLLKIIHSLPPLVLHQFSLSCIVDEVHSTSAIEGIHSTHRELKEIIDGTSKSAHFSSIIKKYEILLYQEMIPLTTCKDIRTLYDDFAHREIIRENPHNKLDGKIFRADSVDVRSSSGKILHSGLYPENKIIDAMNTALDILENEDIPFLIRVAIFHYLFVYIHPFYDGNGRTARFIASYCLAQNFHYLPALRLSVKIKNKQKIYYELIHDTELNINRGDLTPFILGFMTLFYETLCDTCAILSRKLKQLHKYETKIIALFPDDTLMQYIYFALLHSTTFFGQGIPMKELMNFTGKSRNTIKTKLSSMPKNHLIIQKKKKFFYKLNAFIFKN